MSEFAYDPGLFRLGCEMVKKGNELIDYIQKAKASKQPKQEWEILELKHRGSIAKLMEWQKYRCYSQPTFEAPGQQISLSWALDPKNEVSIHSVKRLSDGEVFTVGDTVNFEGQWRTIKAFEIVEREFMEVLMSGYIKGRLPSIWQIKTNPFREPIPVYLTPSEIEKLKALLK